jgi:hypothetical protein
MNFFLGLGISVAAAIGEVAVAVVVAVVGVGVGGDVFLIGALLVLGFTVEGAIATAGLLFLEAGSDNASVLFVFFVLPKP